MADVRRPELARDDLFGAKLAQHAARQPDAPAVSCGADTVGYAQLHRRSNRVARGLAARGVKAGDLVTVGLPNAIGFVEACYGIWKLGATPQPVSFRRPKGELQAIVELAKSPLVVALFEHDVDRPVMTVEQLLALSDDESDLPDARRSGTRGSARPSRPRSFIIIPRISLRPTVG
ncbi:AMP-binding protein [Phenylobacterium sp.]|uniref:AMP-binding protein n=1 Tax=Phenylobacterium sp. TaxID=1871053 RepID=UPI0025FD0617|nr:AMP-binding protein [Phenylobacterium sp.]